jgi:uncharacterized membrane protein YhiD involved in acid resistance
MAADITSFLDWPTLARLMLAVGLGLFVGVARERRRKEAGLRLSREWRGTGNWWGA